ncbi:MAG: CoA transferase, partial [Chloroflexi bacterium]|nr:CoA transferase [Chloroflexota bacterium]
PRLIYASLSGFGHRDLYQSPYSDRPALDVVIQAMSGAMMRAGRDGDPPAFLGFSLADQFAGVLGAFGVLAALRWRDVTGRGTHVDLSMYDAMVTLMSASITEYALNGSLLPRGLIATSAPFGSYDAPDGPFVIAVLGEDLWRRFAPAIGKPEWLDDPRLANGRLRRQHDEEVLKPEIESWAAARTRNEAVDYLNAAGVPAAPVQDMADIFQCPHVAARNMLIEVDDPVVGPIELTGNPIKMSGVADADPAPPPQLGQNTEQVLSRWLGLDSSAVAELRERGVV